MVTEPTQEGHVEEEHALSEKTEGAHGEESEEERPDIGIEDQINLNDMTEEQLLTTIPGLSEHMVHEFFYHRPYLSVLQFRRDVGAHIDDEQLAFYEQFLFVPGDVNESDSETLKQIPGFDEHAAEAFMAARSYASQEELLGALASFVDADQLEPAALFIEE